MPSGPNFGCFHLFPCEAAKDQEMMNGRVIEKAIFVVTVDALESSKKSQYSGNEDQMRLTDSSETSVDENAVLIEVRADGRGSAAAASFGSSKARSSQCFCTAGPCMTDVWTLKRGDNLISTHVNTTAGAKRKLRAYCGAVTSSYILWPQE